MKRVKNFLRRYFITGLLVVIPIWGTYLVLKTLLYAMEGILGRILERHATFYVPGLGIALLIVLILVTGLLATNILGRKIVNFWDDLLKRVPFVRGVYSMLKSIVDAISIQSKGQFNRVGMIQYPREGIYSLAFVTGNSRGEVQQSTDKKLLNIYVPTTPNPTSGFFLMIPEDDIIPLSLSVEEGMKMVISAGFFTPKDVEKMVSPSVEEPGQLVGGSKE